VVGGGIIQARATAVMDVALHARPEERRRLERQPRSRRAGRQRRRRVEWDRIFKDTTNAAVLAGHSVLFMTDAQLLLDLGAQESARALDQRLRHYCIRTGLLVVDEIGYLLRQPKRRPALPGGLPPLRAQEHRHHHQHDHPDRPTPHFIVDRCRTSGEGDRPA